MKETLIFLVTCIILICSGNSMWTFWLGLEMFGFIFFPWIMEDSKQYSSSKIFKYFLIQAIASGLFIFSVNIETSVLSYTFIMVSMMIKLGVFPFHLWVVNISEMMPWNKFSFMMTGAKSGGLVVTLFLSPELLLITPSLLGVVAPLGGMKSSSIRKMLVFSSVSHMSWMMACCCLSPTLLMTYITIYWFIFLSVCKMFKSYNINSLRDCYESPNFLSFWNIVIILSLMGVPPFLGFIPKLFAMTAMIEHGHIIMVMFMGIMNILPMYFYLKMMLLYFSSHNYYNFSFLKLNNNKQELVLTTIGMTLMSISILIFMYV
uniref:NADH dehydrogenase subunit 2 n=1 Tax=Franciscoloa roseicapillae TaxID=2965268 RepID=UPI0026E23DC2|nr:NADH dehydrogenase subunit 2 [Franciscoloa roseicapillae]WIM51557.1 NADH dehydrogenase subunit 2 [Franciscoloa roseicapillae]WIM51570.1 NADH dehydrogenase subunit 2 [Franciscoloa roseicapillae]WIM51580.1 NADH dehydrogenase subunit 2 [Franciscoloa roseicapillae]